MAANLKIIITATDQASGILRGVSKAASGLKSATSAIGTAAAGAAKTLAIMAAAATGLAIATNKVVSQLVSIQAIRAAFESLAEAAGVSADNMVKAMQDASAGMLSATDAMQMFNKAAQLVGNELAVRLPEALQLLTKVAASTGDSMDYLLNSLITGIGRLSPLILDNLGITVDMQAAYEDFAASIGKTVNELSKQEKQMALLNQVMQKLQENTAAIPDVVGTALAKWEGFKTTLRDTAAEIGLALLPALTGLFDILSAKLGPTLTKVKDKFIELGNWVSWFVEWSQKGIDSAALLRLALERFLDLDPGTIQRLFPPTIVEGIDNIKNALPELQQGFQELWPAIQEEADKFSEWFSGPFAETIGTSLDNIAVAMESLGKLFQMEEAQNSLNALTVTLEILAATVGTTVTLITGSLAALIQLLAGDIPGAAETMKTSLESALNSITTISGQTSDEFLATWQSNLEQFNIILEQSGLAAGTTWQQAMADVETSSVNTSTSIVDTWQGNAETMTGIFTGISQAASTFAVTWSGLGSQIATISAGIGANLATAFAGIGPALSGLAANIAGAASQIGSSLASGFGQAVAAISGFVGKALAAGAQFASSIAQGIGSGVGAVIGAASRLLASALSTAQGIAASAIVAGVTFASSVMSGISSLLGGVVAAASAVLSAALTTAISLAVTAIQAGIQFGSMVMSGINSLLGGVVSAATNIITGAIDAAKGIAATAGEIGAAIGSGVADAIAGWAGAIIDALVGAVVAAIQAAKDAVGMASPSKVAMDMGASLMQGLALGIKDNALLPANAFAGATAGALQVPPGVGDQFTTNISKPGVTIVFNTGFMLGNEEEFKTALAPVIEQINFENDLLS